MYLYRCELLRPAGEPREIECRETLVNALSTHRRFIRTNGAAEFRRLVFDFIDNPGLFVVLVRDERERPRLTHVKPFAFVYCSGPPGNVNALTSVNLQLPGLASRWMLTSATAATSPRARSEIETNILRGLQSYGDNN